MTRRALVVDDDEAMVKTLSDVLQLKGWQVSTATSGDDALAVATEHQFDVVLMDIRMPGMDGVDAFKAIRARQPGVKVVLMTAYAAQDRITEAEQSGVTRVLSKPVNVAALLELLEATLSSARSIMLVDDDLPFLKTLSEVLRLHGFETTVSNNLDHATRLVDQSRPVAVLLHLHFGNVPAREVVSRLHARCPDAVLILYSGQSGAEAEADSAMSGEWVHAYLQKPFGVEDVTGVLDAIVDSG